MSRTDGVTTRRTPMYQTLKPDAGYSPDRALWVAVLEAWWADRWTTTQWPTGARQLANDRDREWLHSADRRPGAFLWICEVLDCDPDQVRDALLTPPHRRQGERPRRIRAPSMAPRRHSVTGDVD